MKNGFTLIELLAVIVILAIIALIVTPIVLNIVGNAQDGADKRSIEQYVKVLKQDYLQKKANNYLLTLENYVINYASDANYNGDRVICENIYIENNDLVLENCTVNGRGYYNYKDGKATKGDDAPENMIVIPSPNSFEEDSWSTIIENVKIGNTSAYSVGDEKEIYLEGFTNSDSSNGTFTVRIANKSASDEVCNTNGASESACGFVIEFVDVITEHNMHPSNINRGGWQDSEMRAYINGTIYNSLPEELRTNILETTIVSGYSYSDSANFLTKDKLYLLSTKEVWGETREDTVDEDTRQLDYYKNKGVTMSNYTEAIKKYNGTDFYWFLRSAVYSTPYNFSSVANTGEWVSTAAYFNDGVAPAFRIG